MPVKESIKRSKLKNEPFPDSIKVLESRLLAYKQFSFFRGDYWCKVDGMDSMALISGFVKNEVLKINKKNET